MPTETIKWDDSDASGSVYGKTFSDIIPETGEWHILFGVMSDPDVRAQAEQIMTKSFQCQGVLKKAGDLAIIENSGQFNKDGDYSIFMRYVVLPSDISTNTTVKK